VSHDSERTAVRRKDSCLLASAHHPNSRVKDLVDMALLVGDGELDRRRTRDALHLTLSEGNAPLPTILDVPPPDWQIPFQALAEECRLSPDIAAAFERVRDFLERVLAGS